MKVEFLRLVFGWMFAHVPVLLPVLGICLGLVRSHQTNKALAQTGLALQRRCPQCADRAPPDEA